MVTVAVGLSGLAGCEAGGDAKPAEANVGTGEETCVAPTALGRFAHIRGPVLTYWANFCRFSGAGSGRDTERDLALQTFRSRLLCRGLVGRLWRGIRLVVWRRGTRGLCRFRGWEWGRGSGYGRRFGSRRRGRVGPILRRREGGWGFRVFRPIGGCGDCRGR